MPGPRRRTSLVTALFLATGCARTPPPTVPEAVTRLASRYEPSRDLGGLFHDVQMASLFPDSKTFVDARPRAAVSTIVARYSEERRQPGFDLRGFVERNFEMPGAAGEGFRTDAARNMEEHIRALWPALTRSADSADLRSSLIPLPNPYVVPGGRFREVYYWDSYFTMLGLVESGRTDLVRHMLDNFAHLIRTVGHIPNGNRTYYLGRSQPPYFAAMVGLYARATDSAQAIRYLDAMEAEHRFWMEGSARVAPRSAHRRVARLPNGALLNRYWDDIPRPRPESYREDFTLGQTIPAARREALFRNLRAGAESGWDFSSRWMRNPGDLRTLETIELVPVDLNSLIHHAEVTIAAFRQRRGQPGDAEVAARFRAAAEQRRRALLDAAYDSATGYFYDVRWRSGERVTDRPTLAAAAPMYFGLATAEQGRSVASRLERDFLKSGGFVTTLIVSGQQWDAPNGWPPLQWLAIEGVRRYGRSDLAQRARERWLALNRRTYASTGKMTEKYDVVDPNRRAGGGEYPTQDGFGWSNGVALALSTSPRAEAPRTREGLTRPILAFPEIGVDDSVAYQGYQTRLFRDAAGNTLQVYLDRRANRVVHLLANAENESVGFTARAGGAPAPLRWADDGAHVFSLRSTRVFEHRLVASVPELHLGWVLLGSMRVERDLQYAARQRTAFSRGPFLQPELERLVATIDALPEETQLVHLSRLNAVDVAQLRARLRPRIGTTRSDSLTVARFVHRSIDGRDSLSLELRVDPRHATATWAGDSLILRSVAGDSIGFGVRVASSGRSLTPLARDEIFTPRFLDFLRTASSATDGAGQARARWLERQVRGVELLASREKLMAGLPTYATYFGRDMLVTALMMQSIWRPDVVETVIASVLRKLSPSGQVSHEEALGGQAVREAAAEYVSLVDESRRAGQAGRRAIADSLLARAEATLGAIRVTRENYHMIDDELQLPVLVDRWLADTSVSPERQRAFLSDSSDGEPRIVRLLRELGVVARMTAAYARQPVATNLISFPARDLGWAATSWRDSNVGYAGGRFAMDVNAIWAPEALHAMAGILRRLSTLGFDLAAMEERVADLRAGHPLGVFVRDESALARATAIWRGAVRHFGVTLMPADAQRRVRARLAALPAHERAHWTRVLAPDGGARDTVRFMALALDAGGRPIPVLNTDPATALFLGLSRASGWDVVREARSFSRTYPTGLLVDSVGPVVANDAYATPAVWQAFERDRYHGPRVVWGREVNLFALGVARLLAEPATVELTPAAVDIVRAALERVLASVEASGFRSELWSYEVRDGRLRAIRYGSGADVQLWSTTTLAVHFALAQLAR